MNVLILGIGDAFTRRHFGSSALIRVPSGGFVLIDCPDLIHRVLLEATTTAGEGWKADASNIDDILLTHLHGDHCNGLESFGFYRRVLRLRDPKVIRPRLHVTPPVAARLWDRLGPAMGTPMGCDHPCQLNDFFDVRIIDVSPAAPSATPAVVAGLNVQCRFTGHPVPTVGYVITDASGGSLGWSSDTPFDRGHIDWLDQANLIVHESNLGPSHTPIESLNALPKELKAKMRLIHLVDDFDPARTDIRILRAGEVLTC